MKWQAISKPKNLFTWMFMLLLSITSLHADSVVEGYTSCSIQEAIDMEAARGGGIVFCPKGEYILRNAIYLKSNVKLKGQGKTTVFKKCPRYTSRITAEITKGDYWIHIEDASSFQCGDGITVFSQSLKPARAWVTEVVEIAPGALCLQDAAPFEVCLSSQPFVFCSFPCLYCKGVKNISVYDLSIDGNRQENPVIDTWWDSGIGCRDSEEIEINNVRVIGAAGDGVSLNTSHHVSITDSEINGSARLGVHVGSGSQYTYIGNSKICNSGLAGVINVDGLYLCFSAAFGLYENNVITGTRGAGLSIGRWDSGNIFLKNKVSDNGIGLLFREDSFETANITFLQNEIGNNHSWNLLMRKPVYNIFMDVWPEKRSSHPQASFLYYFDFYKNTWLRFQ